MPCTTPMPSRKTTMPLFRHFLPCLGLLLTAASLHAAPAATLQVSGAVVKTGAWDAARLRRDFGGDLRTVTYTLKGKSHTAQALPLLALVQAAGPRLNPNIKNHRLQFVVLVRGRDGYTAAFSLAELSPDLGQRTAWLALSEDGQPIPAEFGPASLLVPGDAKPGRWVHGVAAIVVRDEAAVPDGK